MAPLSIREHKIVLNRMALLGELERICREHNVLLDAVLDRGKHTRVLAARTACCVYLRTLQMSYTEIGTVMLRHHGSIMNLVAKAREKAKGAHGAPPSGAAA